MKEYIAVFENPSVRPQDRNEIDTRGVITAGLDCLRSWCDAQAVRFEVLNDSFGLPSKASVLLFMEEDDYLRIKDSAVESVDMLYFIFPNEDLCFSTELGKAAEEFRKGEGGGIGIGLDTGK